MAVLTLGQGTLLDAIVAKEDVTISVVTATDLGGIPTYPYISLSKAVFDFNCCNPCIPRWDVSSFFLEVNPGNSKGYLFKGARGLNALMKR